MRYSQFFEKARTSENSVEAEQWLRKAEEYAGKSAVEDLCLCAEAWWTVLENCDQAMRCLLLAEARCWNDCRELIYLIEAYWHLFRDVESIRRCVIKWQYFARPGDDYQRMKDFLEKHGINVACENSNPSPEKFTQQIPAPPDD